MVCVSELGLRFERPGSINHFCYCLVVWPWTTNSPPSIKAAINQDLSQDFCLSCPVPAVLDDPCPCSGRISDSLDGWENINILYEEYMPHR